MRNIYPSRMCATFGTQQNNGLSNSALRSAEITTVQSARHTVQYLLMKDIPLLHQFDDNTQPPRASPLHHGFRHHANWARTKSQSQQNARPQTRLLASHCSDCGQDFVISPNCHLAPCCGINAEGTWLFDLGKINLTDDINELQLLILNYIQYIGPGGLLKHLRTSGGLSSFGRSSYLSMREICEDIALSKEAQTCLAKPAPKLAANLDCRD